MHVVVAPHNLDETLPLIYMWEIRDENGNLIGRYVGKAKAGSGRPRTQYSRNVRNILLGKPYRRGNPEGYRKVHHALADAQRKGHSAVLHFLCNVSENENINVVEQYWIKIKECKGEASWQLNG